MKPCNGKGARRNRSPGSRRHHMREVRPVGRCLVQPTDPETSQTNERGDQQLLLSRQELFDLVWAFPRQTLAARYPSISS